MRRLGRVGLCSTAPREPGAQQQYRGARAQAGAGGKRQLSWSLVTRLELRHHVATTILQAFASGATGAHFFVSIFTAASSRGQFQTSPCRGKKEGRPLAGWVARIRPLAEPLSPRGAQPVRLRLAGRPGALNGPREPIRGYRGTSSKIQVSLFVCYSYGESQRQSVPIAQPPALTPLRIPPMCAVNPMSPITPSSIPRM